MKTLHRIFAFMFVFSAMFIVLEQLPLESKNAKASIQKNRNRHKAQNKNKPQEEPQEEENEDEETTKAETLLSGSVFIGDIKTAKQMFSKAKLSQKNKSILLNFPSVMGDNKMVEFLLSHSINVDQQLVDEDIPTPLFYAAYLGHFGVVAKLVAAGANVNAKDSYGYTPLFLACGLSGILGNDENDYTKVVKILLEANAKPNVSSKEGLTPLIVASMAGNKDIVSSLLSAGAKINAKTKENFTACQYAVMLGNEEVVNILKKAGARCQRIENNTLEEKFSKEDATKALLLLVKNIQGNHRYLSTIYTNSAKPLIGLLLSFGADINAQDDEGYTPLMRILQKEEIDIVAAKTLIDQGADVNLKNNEGETALHIFAKTPFPFLPLLERLINARADVNAKDKKGVTPLICLIKDLQSIQDKKCLGPIVLYLNSKVAETLLRTGADVNAKDANGNTVLHHLLQSYDGDAYIKLLPTLLDFGADPFVKNNEEKRPVDFVHENTSVFIIDFLSKKTGLSLPLKKENE